MMVKFVGKCLNLKKGFNDFQIIYGLIVVVILAELAFVCLSSVRRQRHSKTNKKKAKYNLIRQRKEPDIISGIKIR